MSIYDYEQSLALEGQGWSFYALIMAAMRQADTDNLDALRQAFPERYAEFQKRFNAPGGYLPDEVPEAEDTIHDDVLQAIGGEG